MTDRLGEHTLFEQEHKEACDIAAGRLLEEMLRDPVEHAVRTAMEQKYGKVEK